MDNTSIGYLVVNVRYANGAAPVENSRVVLGADVERSFEILTDADGKTQPIPLEAGRSYSIKVFADGFVEAEYMDIPIIGNVTTLQNADLFPIPSAMKEAYNER